MSQIVLKFGFCEESTEFVEFVHTADAILMSVKALRMCEVTRRAESLAKITIATKRKISLRPKNVRKMISLMLNFLISAGVYFFSD